MAPPVPLGSRTGMFGAVRLDLLLMKKMVDGWMLPPKWEEEVILVSGRV